MDENLNKNLADQILHSSNQNGDGAFSNSVNNNQQALPLKPEDFISLAEASKLTDYHQDYLGFLCRTGKLKGFKMGRNWVTTKTALDDFIKNYKNGISEVVDETGNKIPVHVVKAQSNNSQSSVLSENSTTPLIPEVSISELPGVQFKAVEQQPKQILELSHLRSEVFEGIEKRIQEISAGVSQLENQVKKNEAQKIQAAKESPKEESKQQDLVLLPAALPLETRPQLTKNFVSNFDFVHEDKTADLTSLSSPTKFALGISSENIKKLYKSFTRPKPSNLPVVFAALVIALLGITASVLWSNFATQKNLAQHPTQTDIFYGKGNNTGQLVINNGNTTQVINQVLGIDKSQLYSAIDSRLNQYLAEGKFKGDPGAQGLTGPAGSGTTITYFPPSGGGTGGSALGITYFSADTVVAHTITTNELTVNNNTTLNGNTTIANLTVSNINPGFTQGSVIFQGSSGLAQDNGNLFYNASTTQLAVGTNAPASSAILQLDSTTKGFLAPRMTAAQRDAIASGSPATGLLIYNTDTNAYNVYNGTSWTAVGSGGGGSGSVATGTPGSFAYYQAADTNLFSQPSLFFFSNNIGIGTRTPSSTLFVQGTSTAPSANLLTVASSSGSSLFQITSSGNVNVATLTPSSLVMSDANNNLQSVTLGTGLSFSGATLNSSNAFSGSGTNGLVARWTATSSLGTGLLIDDGSVSGVNATSSSYTFNIQGSSGQNPLQISSSTGASFLTVATNGSTTISSLGTGIVRSSSGSLFNGTIALGSSDVSGVLGVSNGGIGTTTLGSLTASSSNLSISGGQNVLIGTSTQITLTDTPTFSSLTLSGLGGGGSQCLHVNNSGLISGTSADCGATGGGIVAGGVRGFVTTWASSTGLTYGISIDNGTVAGINATSSTITYNIQGAAGSNDIFNIASSSGISVLRVTNNQRVGIGSTTPTATLVVQGTSTSPTLPVLVVASSTGSQLLTVLANGMVGIGTTAPLSLLSVNGDTFINGNATATNITALKTINTLAGNPVLASSTRAGLSAANHVFVSGRYAYVIDTTNGLIIFDVTIPSSPIKIAATTSGLSTPAEVYVSGRYAYVTDTTNGLIIFDVSNPTAPVKVGSSTSGLTDAFGISVSGRYAYVTDVTNGLIIFDVSNPASPVRVGSSNSSLTTADNIQVSGNYAYIADAVNGIVIFNISNPAAPVKVGSSTTSLTSAYGVYVSGRYAYIADLTRGGGLAGNGLVIFDVSNPASPAKVGSSTTGSLMFAAGVVVSGRYAYVADDSSASGYGLVIFDVSNPAAPVKVGNVTTGLSSPVQVFVSGRYAYITDVDNGLIIFDLLGGEFNTAMVHSLEAGNLQVRNDITLQGNLSVGTGVNVGSGGIFSAGAIAVGVASSTQVNAISGYFTGLVGIGSTSPTALLVIQATSTNNAIPLLTIASTTGTTLFQVAGNGSTTISSLIAGPVRSTAAGLLFNSAIALGSSDVSGILGASNGGTGTSTAPTVTGQILAADGTGTKYAPTNLVAGSNITITTTTPGQITFATTGLVGGSGTTGYSAIWNGASSLTNGAIIDNGTVAGIGATSSTISFNIQGTSGSTNDLFNTASSTGTSTFVVKSSGNVGIGTSTPTALLSLPLGTTAAGGINFGDATANLYRSSVGVVKTDGSLYVSSGVTAGSYAGILSGAGSGVNIGLNGTTHNPTSNTTQEVAIKGGNFTPASGSGQFEILAVGYGQSVTSESINQTGSASGITRGVQIKPTLTSTVDYRNLDVAAMNNNLSNAAPVQTQYNVLFNPMTYGTTSTTAYTIANASTLTINGAPIASTTSLTITSSTALSILSNAVTASTTNAQGLWVEAPTGATNNYAAIFNGGNVGIGIANPNTTLHIYKTGSNVPGLTIQSSSGTADPLLFFGTGSQSSNATVGAAVTAHRTDVLTAGDTDLLFKTSAGSTLNTNMILKANGYVGIGTSSPVAALTVHYDASSTASSALYAVASTTPVLQLGPMPLASPSANGTYLAITSPTSFTGNLIDAQYNSVSRFKVGFSGAVTGLSYTAGNVTTLTTGINANAAFTINAFNGTGYDISLSSLNPHSVTSGTLGIVNVTAVPAAGFLPTSGNAVFNALSVAPYINQTATASGTTRGIFINPTLISAADYRNLETSSTLISTLTASTTVSTQYNVLFNPITYTSASSVQVTLANASTLNIAGAPIGTSASTTISSSTALTIQGNALTNVTNGYGMFLQAPTGATNNYAAAFMGGNVGIGTSTPITALQIGSGQITVPAGTNGAPSLSFAGLQAGIYSPTTNQLAIEVGNSQMLTVQTSILALGNNSAGDFSLGITAASGATNRDGGNLVIYPKASTGTGTAGSIVFQVANASTTSGSFVNTVSEKMRLTNVGLGIGSSTPSATLVVQGTSSAPTLPLLTVASSSGSSFLTVASNGSTTLSSLAVAACDVMADTSGGLYCGTNGAGGGVSGGTNGYVARFTSASTLSIGLLIDNGTVAGVNATSTSFTFNLQGSAGVNPFNVSSSTGTSLFAVTQSGQIGIGTTSPSGLLTIQGSATNQNLFNITSSTGTSLLNVSWYGGLTQNISSTTAVNIQDGSGNQVFAVDTTQSTTNAGLDITAGGSQTGNLLNFYSSGSTLLMGVTAFGGVVQNIASTTAINIQNGSGTLVFNVDTLNRKAGVNTTTSASLLGVQSIGQTVDLFDLASTSGASLLRVTQAGWLGINTTTPLTVAAIVGQAGTNDIFDIASSTGTSILRVTATSRVGIGTTTPLTRLAVVGAAGANDILDIATSTGTSLLRITSTGKIGIGTSTPNSLVHIGLDASSTANSTLYTASTTNGGILQLGQLPLTSPSANGTYLAVNTPASFSGNLIDMQLNGTTQFRVDSTGRILSTGGVIDLVSSNQRLSGSASNGFLMSGNNAATANANILRLQNAAATNLNPTSGTDNMLNIFTAANGFNPTSGTAQFNSILINSGINQTASANGVTRGIYLNPILTSAYDYRNFEIAATTTTVSNAASPAQTVYNVLFNPITYQTNSTTAYTIANASTLTIAGAPIASTTSLTITSSTALSILGSAVTASTTNSYGLWVAANTGATNNYAAAFMGGNVGIGSTSPTALLSVQGSSGSATNLLSVASSTGTSYLTIASNGSTTLSSLGTGCVGVAAGSLYTTSCGGGSLSGSGTAGFSTIWTSSSALGNGVIIDNGTVAGIGATSSTISFNIQGTSGSANDIFNVASSSGASLFVVKPSGNIGIGTSTPGATLDIYGSQPNIRLSDSNNVSPAGVFNLRDSGDSFGIFRGVIGVSASALFAANSTQVAVGNLGIQSLSAGNFTGTNLTYFPTSGSSFINNGGNVGIGTTTPATRLDIYGSGTTDPFNISSSSGTSILRVTSGGRVGIGNTAPISALHVEGSTSATGANAVGAIFASTTLLNTTAGGFEFGNRFLNVVSGSASGTYEGLLIRMTDSMSNATNTVRGLEVQADSGTNTLGINTAIVGFAKTFGVQGISSGLAGGTAQPAGVYAEIQNSTVGNALRAYSATATTLTLFSMYQETSAFTGSGLVMDFGNGTGSFATGTFINLKVAGSSKFKVMSNGGVFINMPDAGTANALCHTSQTGTSTEEIVDCTSSPAADYREMYPTFPSVTWGDLLVTATGSSTITSNGDHLDVLNKSAKAYDKNIIGVASKPEESTDFNTIGYNVKDEDHPYPVALNGRVQVKIATSTIIHAGDYITSSNIAGVAMKAERSGQVIGQALEDFDPASLPSADSTGSPQASSGPAAILVFVKPGFQVINNTFVLNEDDGQLASATSTPSLSAASGLAVINSFLINQKGTGNLLQLQQNGENRLLIAGNGAFNLFASTTIATSTILSVNNGTTTQFSITAAGHITVGHDTAGTATIKTGDNQAVVTFDVPYDTVPKVVVTVQGLPNFYYGVATKTLEGFEIQMSTTTAKDISFDWVALAQPATSTSQSSLNPQIVVVNHPNNPGQIVSGGGNGGGSSGGSDSTPPPADDTSGTTPPPSDDGGQVAPQSDSGLVAGDSTAPPDNGSNGDNGGNETPPPVAETPPAE